MENRTHSLAIRDILCPVNEALQTVAAAQHGLFTTEQALDAGYGRHARRYAGASGKWLRVFRGVYVQNGAPITQELRARAALLVLPESAVISHQTALELRGCAVVAPAVGPEAIHVTMPHGVDVAPRTGIVVHRCNLPDSDVVRASGIRLTTAARAVLEVARVLPRVEAVVVADAALHARLCTFDQLDRCLIGMFGLPGVGQAREVRGLTDARAESPMETRLRLVLVDGGLPAPDLQVDVFDDTGRWIARVDLAYEASKIAIEFDGRATHDADNAFVRDRERQNALVAAGWTVLRYVGRDVYRRSPAIVNQVRAELAKTELAA